MVKATVAASVMALFLQSPQAPVSVFRTSVDAVHIEVLVFKGKTWCRGTSPERELRTKDFSFVLDGNTYVPVEVTEDSNEPGHYVVGFIPPEKYRDGLSHRVQVRIQKRGSVQLDFVLPKPGDQAPVAERRVCCPVECRQK
jgi:hypothetical protein